MPHKKENKQPPEMQEVAQQPDELETLRCDLQNQTEQYLRLCAEYDNFRKRSQKEREAIYPEATAAAVAALLPVADNFERAVAAECSDENYKKGTELTYQSLNDAFAKLGVSSFGEPGDQFDPELHNAVMTEENEAFPAGSITDVFQRGYKLGDKVIRHAMVKVAN